MYVISFSLGKEILKKGSREYRRMQSYAEHLKEYHIIVLSRGTTRQHFVDGNMHIYSVGARTKIGTFLTGFSIAHLILRERLTSEQWVVTSQDPLWVGLLGLLVGKVLRVAHVVQVHGDMFGPHGYSVFIQKLGLFVIQKSNRVRVVSERIKWSLLSRGVSEKKITVLPIRVELESFLAVTENQSQGPLRIVTVSRLAPEKNIDMLVRSFATLKKEGVQATLEIVGSGPEEQTLKALVRTCGIAESVTFTPWTDDIPAVMSRANIFALTSMHEGYALVLLEALAAGVPVVTTDVGCAGETIENEKHGLVVPVGDTVAFTEALRTLVEDSNKRIEYGNNGRELAQSLAQTSSESYAEAWVATFSV